MLVLFVQVMVIFPTLAQEVRLIVIVACSGRRLGHPLLMLTLLPLATAGRSTMYGAQADESHWLASGGLERQWVRSSTFTSPKRTSVLITRLKSECKLV
jgi:hypothetical protein